MTSVPPEIAAMAVEPSAGAEGSLVVSPSDVEDLVLLMEHATRNRQSVQVIGGGTHSGFGSPPQPDITISMADLGRILVWEPDDLTIVVGAGAGVADVEAELAAAGQSLVLPEHPGSATVGGVIAAGVSSLRRGRLYPTRERVLETVVVTGDGRVVRSGGRVVKNVTGYDLSRLHVGAFGSLGVIVSVCLKLWPVPPASATVDLTDLGEATRVTRPLAVLEERDGARVFLVGTGREVEAMLSRFEGTVTPGLDWPEDPAGPCRWSLRVPAGLTPDAISRLPGEWEFLALHGVGEIRAASGDMTGAEDLREWAETVGGRLVSVARPADAGSFDPWGRPPPGLALQRELISRFDPARVINPGRLPGGL